MSARQIGFLGLGDMGEPMAAQLLRGGHRVRSCVYRRREALERLSSLGLEERDSPNAVAQRSEILITCVVDEAQTDAVLRGPHGVLAGLAPDSVLVIASTVSAAYCQAIADELKARRIHVLDCPVSGGRARAERGELALIAGGEEAVLERCRAVLETMGNLFHCGGVGMGQIAKLINQGLLFSTVQLVQEGRALGRSYGMNVDTLMDVLNHSTARSFASENWDMFVSIWAHVVPLAQKDLQLCLDAAHAQDVQMPLVAARRDLPWSLADSE
ncbi:MAG: NAD(P)-dependent oxidoreductase [Gammaproteobacteria bacterium]|nr:NAD(P)-dependent oxidoreductase [Gammaproteobacteria bacterium]